MADISKYLVFRFIPCTAFSLKTTNGRTGPAAEFLKNDVLDEYLKHGWQVVKFIQRDGEEYTGILAIIGHEDINPKAP
ncbi:MAG: hypothetical protein ACQESA_02245 [Patescibacteria group bacterium]